MIKVIYEADPENGRLTMKAEGHAGYAPAGQDIVCAAVSCLMQTLAYSAAEDGRTSSCIDQGDDGPVVSVQAGDSVLMRGKFELVADGLSLLAEQYPENVDFKKSCKCTPAVDLQLFAADAGSRDPGEHFDLQLFADGDGAAEGAGDAAAPAEEKSSTARSKGREAAAAEVDEMLEPAPEEEPLNSPSDDVGAAHSSPDRGAENSGSSTEDTDDPDARRKEFGRLMREQYPRELSEMVMRATQEAYKELTGDKSPVGRILNALGQKYGTAPGDLDALADAVESGVVKNDAYYEDMAMKKGISVQLAREMDALESENAQHRAAEQQREEAARMAAIQQEWDAAAERIRAQDPGFDIQAALADPDFAQMLKLGVKMEDAYKARYFDDIMARKTAETAKKTENGVVERIRQRGTRPSENGVNPGGAAVLKTDVSKLTPAQCEELERRAMRGQIITF